MDVDKHTLKKKKKEKKRNNNNQKIAHSAT
jgi:hypothetical protein